MTTTKETHLTGSDSVRSWSSTYSYSFPTSIRFGNGVIQELGPHLCDKGFNRPLIVTDAVCIKLPFLKAIVGSLEEKYELSPQLFSDIHKNPIASDPEHGAKTYRKHNCDAVIGIGGGAALDVARATALAVNNRRHILDYEELQGGEALITEPIPYFITVPTTSGTGSEVGRSTIIAVPSTREKKIIYSPKLLAQQVFADPLLTKELPPAITAATGMDALTHHIEAFLAKGIHPLCDGIAIEGIRLIWNSLEEATLAPHPEARAKMMIASLMGAVAFQKGLGVVHSCAHPLSTRYDIHHGLANAVMLPHGLQFNQSCCRDRFTFLEQILDIDDLIAAISNLGERIGIPRKLSALGVQAEDLDSLADLAFRDVCHQCNPRSVSKQQFYRLYEEAL